MRGTRLIVFLLFVIAAVVVAVVVVRAVGDDGDSGNLDATSWADSVCTSVSDWKSTISSLADVSGGLTKDSLRQKLDDGDAATEQLVRELRDLGAPDLEAGDEVKQKLDDDTDVLQSSYESLKTKAQAALDSSSATGFLSALAQLGTPFQTLLDRISTTITDLQNANVSADARAELRRAFDDADSCQALRSGD